MKTTFKKLFYQGIQNPRDAINLIFNLPKLIKLYYRLFKDPRTPFHLKIILILAIIYVISPIDLLPDFLLPLIGQIDDLIILIAALRYFLKKCPPQIIAEHMKLIELGS